MLFVSISFALGSQRQRSFQWNMGLRITISLSPHFKFAPPGGGGGGGGVLKLGLEKGIDCGSTVVERWLSPPKMAKKGGLSSYYIVK